MVDVVTGATGAAVGSEGGVAVFEVDLSLHLTLIVAFTLRLAFIVAFTSWWRRPSAASQASHLCAKM